MPPERGNVTSMVSLADLHTSANVPSLLRRTRPLHVITRLRANSSAAAATALDTAWAIPRLGERCTGTSLLISSANLRRMSAVEELLAIGTVIAPPPVLYTTLTAKSFGEEPASDALPCSAPPVAVLAAGSAVAWVAGATAALFAAQLPVPAGDLGRRRAGGEAGVAAGGEGSGSRKPAAASAWIAKPRPGSVDDTDYVVRSKCSPSAASAPGALSSDDKSSGWDRLCQIPLTVSGLP